MNKPRNIFAIASLVALAFLAGCTQPGDVSKAQATATSAFYYDSAVLPGNKPWTNEKFRNNPNNFQFAVIGDRTGGSDPKGIFKRAMDQLNLLQPEFVINVGDLVEGYANDKAVGHAMWDEVKPMLDKLEMPFFYVGGNHDLGNDTMTQVWNERYGATYYYFIYRNVLFLVMNSEDPSNPVPKDIAEKTIEYKKLQEKDPAKAKAMLAEFMAGLDAYKAPMVMSDRQLDYFRKVLANHRNVRWTFVFLHQPDWDNPGEHKALQAIDTMLKDRPYTVIAGHLHYYDYKQRNGRDYITMGPAGASWHKDGPGNVDHFLWITMKNDKPEIAKVTLDGIYDRQGRSLQLKQMYERDAGTGKK